MQMLFITLLLSAAGSKSSELGGNGASGIFIPDVFSGSSEIFPCGGRAACVGAVGVGQLPVAGVCTRGAVNVQIQCKRSAPKGLIRTGAAPCDVAVLLTALVTVTEALPCHVRTRSCSDLSFWEEGVVQVRRNRLSGLAKVLLLILCVRINLICHSAWAYLHRLLVSHKILVAVNIREMIPAVLKKKKAMPTQCLLLV